jgi:hypothetical protein
MRFRELLEYKRDKTATNYSDKLWDSLVADRSSGFHTYINPKDTKHPDDQQAAIDRAISSVLTDIELSDPTPNKQYTEWLVRRYIDGSISRYEDVTSTWADLLHKYHRLKVRRMLPSELMDINKFKTADDLLKLHDSVHEIFNNTDEKEEIQKGNAKVVFDNEEVRVIIPEDQDAACYYGQGTKWCTAAKKRNVFDDYNANGPLFIILPKKPKYEGEKYQLHKSTNQFTDEQDKYVTLYHIFHERFTNEGTIEFFDKEIGLFCLLDFIDPKVKDDVVQAIKKEINKMLLELKFYKETQDNEYHDWLVNRGYNINNNDTSVYYSNDDMPDYFEFNPKLGQAHSKILNVINESLDNLWEVGDRLGEADSLGLTHIPTLIAELVHMASKRQSWENLGNKVADEIKKYTIDAVRSKNPIMPAWTLNYEYQIKNKTHKKTVSKTNYDNKL